jgi:hypothetical protein
MATKNGKKTEEQNGQDNRKDQPPRWQGGAVEDKPGGEAERAAERAEGNAPVRADAENRRLHHPSIDEQPQVPQRTDAGGREEDIEAASEEHAARRDAGERSPRGKL